jgi:hypothetical protein
MQIAQFYQRQGIGTRMLWELSKFIGSREAAGRAPLRIDHHSAPVLVGLCSTCLGAPSNDGLMESFKETEEVATIGTSQSSSIAVLQRGCCSIDVRTKPPVDGIQGIVDGDVHDPQSKRRTRIARARQAARKLAA